MKTLTRIVNIKTLTCALVLALLAALAVPAAGQLASSTNLTGTVTDTSGAIIPRANVRAVNTATQVAYSAVTSRTGVERPELIGTPVNACGSLLVSCITNATAAGTYGDTPRDMLYGPGLWDLEFALDKNFRMGERFNFDLRGEFFNIFNHPSFGEPGATFGLSTFGDITSLAGANPTRVIQIMARLTF